MSSGESSSSYGESYGSSSDVDIHEGFKVVGIVLGFLFFLIVLRICCIGFIDLAILGDTESFTRFMSELRRRLCPFWHPRTQPQGVAMPPTQGGIPETDIITIDVLLTGLNKQEKQDLLASILTSEVVSEEDIQTWRLKNDNDTVVVELPDGSFQEKAETSSGSAGSSSSTNAHDMVCPICINEIEVGNYVVSLTGCEHKFHKDCLSQWLSTHTRDCPYCRAEIISQEMLDEAYRLRMLSEP